MRSWICQVLCVDMSALHREHFLFVTCGNWDVKTIMPKQCSNPVPGTVDVQTQRLLLWRWCNIKDVFREHFKLSVQSAPTGMKGMLRNLKIPLDGQHHLGMDDVSNLAKILRKLVLQGAKIEATGYAAGETVPQRPRTQAQSPVPQCTVQEQSSPQARDRANLKRPNLGADGTDAADISPPKILRTASVVNPYLKPASSSSVSVVEVDDEVTPFWEDSACSTPSAPRRSADSILAKYSALRRADEAGHNVRIKKKLLEVANNDNMQLSPGDNTAAFSRPRIGGKGKGKSLLGLSGGKCRRMR